MVQVLAPRGGPTGLLVTLAKWGMAIIDVPSGFGAINKYTVGPAWTNAEFQTIGAAIDQAVLDGHSTATVGNNVLFELYPVRYTENIVFPEELPRFIVRGAGAGDVGSTINGTVQIDIPGATANAAFQSVEFLGAVTLNQAIATATTTSLRFESCSFFSTLAVNSATALGCSVQAWDTDFFGTVTAVARSWRHDGGQLRNANIQVGTTIDETGVKLGTSTANAYTFSAGTITRISGCPVIFGRITFAGAQCLMWQCVQNYAGSPAVTDNTTGSAWCQGNIFSHDAGPAGPVWIKTDPAGIFHDGGNDFAEGQLYPWWSIAGTRTDRSETDDELRRVLRVSGNPVLTPAQVGSQRKTTVGKIDGGGVVQLPALAAVEPGCTLIVKDLFANAFADPFTIVGDSGEPIDGNVAGYDIDVNLEAVQLQANQDDGEWIVIGSYP